MKHAEADSRTRTGHGAIDAGVILYAHGFYEKCGYDVLSKAKASDGNDSTTMLCAKNLPDTVIVVDSHRVTFNLIPPTVPESSISNTVR